MLGRQIELPRVTVNHLLVREGIPLAVERLFLLVDLGNNQWQVTVHTPPDGNVAPPGWYMLTAATQVDGYPFTGSAKYVPSEAKWIKLE